MDYTFAIFKKCYFSSVIVVVICKDYWRISPISLTKNEFRTIAIPNWFLLRTAPFLSYSYFLLNRRESH